MAFKYTPENYNLINQTSHKSKAECALYNFIYLLNSLFLDLLISEEYSNNYLIQKTKTFEDALYNLIYILNSLFLDFLASEEYSNY